jgi:hypothetical protein
VRPTSARAVAEAHLARIDALDGALGAYTAVTRERALAEADAVDAAVGKAIDQGLRTGDIFSPSETGARRVGTREMGAAIVAAL